VKKNQIEKKIKHNESSSMEPPIPPPKLMRNEKYVTEFQPNSNNSLGLFYNNIKKTESVNIKYLEEVEKESTEIAKSVLRQLDETNKQYGRIILGITGFSQFRSNEPNKKKN